MSVHRVASTYAKSLIDLAQEQNKLETIKGDMESFQKATEQRDFYLLLKSPIVNPSKKGQILKAIFEGKYDKMTMAFLNIVLNKGREEYLAEIASAFMDQYKSIKNISTVKLITSAPLTAENLEKIRQKIQADAPKGETIEIETSVDESLIGGFVLEYDHKRYDASVAHKLDKIRKEFKDNQYISQLQ